MSHRKSANAAGLPEINRRRMLLGLAAASTAAATVAAASSAPAENPELIQLGDMLGALEADCVNARWHQDQLIDQWSPHWPTAHPDLTSDDRTDELERDFEGWGSSRRIYSTNGLKWRINRAKSALKSRATTRAWHSRWSREEWEAELDEAQRLHALAAAYEAETDRIKKAANYADARKATYAAQEALGHHVTRLMALRDVTMVGLLIKAEALAAWGRVIGPNHTLISIQHNNWYAEIADSVLRHAKGGAV